MAVIRSQEKNLEESLQSMQMLYKTPPVEVGAVPSLVILGMLQIQRNIAGALRPGIQHGDMHDPVNAPCDMQHWI